MTIDALIMAAGAFVAILPFLGFPIKWDSVLLVVVGTIIIALGIVIRRRGVRRTPPLVRTPQTFVESAPGSADTHEAA
ncbi:MAG: hypothetical protein WAZ27_02770 [Minisyncoccia bacterium]